MHESGLSFGQSKFDYGMIQGGSNPRPQAQWYTDYTTAPPLLLKIIHNNTWCRSWSRCCLLVYEEKYKKISFQNNITF